jgi:uncharacterized membrane protein YheB (UPF0754 family)
MAIVPDLLVICGDVDPEEIDPLTVEIFNQYKWALKRLKVDFNQQVGQSIIQTSHDLENIFIAFCGWTLSLIHQGEKITKHNSTNNLLQALGDNWYPTATQKALLKTNAHILESLESKMWQKAGEMLGMEQRNSLIFHLAEDGTIDPEEAKNIDPEKLRALKQYQRYLWELLWDS